MSYFKISPLACCVAMTFYGVPLLSTAAELNTSSNLAAHQPNHTCHVMTHDQQASCEFAPIVITAAKPQGTQAFRIQADPKQPIQPVPASDGADYLKQVAGFASIRNGGTNGDPVFRGLFGSRLKILNNGSEMLGACPARMDAPTSYIAPSTFDQIEIVKGPQTVLWGAASAATVNFKRQKPNFDEQPLQAQASVMAGSNQRFDSNIDTSLGNALGYARLMANTSQANDYKDGDGNKVPAKWEKWNTDIALGYTPAADTWLEFTAGLGDGEARYAGRSMDGSQFERDSLGLRFEQKNLSPMLKKLEGQINYNKADHVMDNYSLRTPTAMDMGGMEHDHAGMGGMANHGMAPSSAGSGGMTSTGMGTSGRDSGMASGGMAGMAMDDPAMAMELARRTISGRVAATLNWDQLEMITGIDANTNKHKGRMGGRNYTSMPWEADAEFQNIGVFGEGTWKLANNRKIASGLRLDWAQVKDLRSDEVSFNETRKETLPSGFMRLENQMANNQADWQANSYIGVGYVERMPDYWELFSPVHAGTTNAYRGVDTEKTTQLDLGFNYKQNRLSAWTSAYVGQIDDYILMSYHHHAGHMGNSAGAKNVDATIAGAEAGMGYELTDALKADLNLAYAWGRNDDSKQPLPQIAPLEARLGLNYHQDNYSLGAVWRLVAAQNRIALNQGNIVGYDLQPSNGFGVFSVNGAYQFNSRISASIGVDNLLDKTYAEHLNKAGNSSFGYASNQIINEMGRNYWARVAFKY